MVATTYCTGCGAASVVGEATCAYCGTPRPGGPVPGAPPPGGGAPPREAGGPAREARRVRGLAVPLVAAVLVAGIGLPLTAGAVALVGGVGRDPGPVPTEGRAQLTGAVSADGPAIAVGCQRGAPVLVTVGTGEAQYRILLAVPTGATSGTHRLRPESETYVTVARAATRQAWTSQGQADATGEITLRGDGRLSARFQGLVQNTRESGTVDGAVEVRCG